MVLWETLVYPARGKGVVVVVVVGTLGWGRGVGEGEGCCCSTRFPCLPRARRPGYVFSLPPRLSLSPSQP